MRYGYGNAMRSGFWLPAAEVWFKRSQPYGHYAEHSMWLALFLAAEAGEI